MFLTRWYQIRMLVMLFAYIYRKVSEKGSAVSLWVQGLFVEC